ncbi:MAG: hypothetical protein EOO17_01470 [Chloroflexi bacterium]|nr:MAG: hypothetical protein EOO17_01470 [Chloroflexota bacterium]
MSADVTNQEIHLDEFSDGVYFRITTFQPATRLLSGSEGLESEQYRQLYIYPTAGVRAHGQDMVKGVIVTGMNGAGDHISSFIPRILRVRDQFRVATDSGVYHLGSITQIIQGSI